MPDSLSTFLREWAHCLPLAGLCCIRLWLEPWLTVSQHQSRDRWFALMTCCILSAILVIGRRFAPPRPWIFAAALVLFAKELYLVAALFGLQNWKLLLILIPVAAVIPGFLYRAATALTACLIALTVWGTISSPPIEASASTRVKAPPAASAQRRVIWIVADDLDERLAFSQRPLQLQLPALARFRDHAEYRCTLKSPIQLEPRKLDALRKIAPSAVVSLQTRARQANSYDPHPLANRFRSFLETERFSPFGLPLSAEHHIEQMLEIERGAVAAASDPGLGFVFLHLPHARPPYVWDAAHGEPATAVAVGKAARLRNLAWVDSVFANIRSGMETTGVWDRSVVLVTATFDGNTGNAPFLLKSPDWVDLDPTEPLDPERTESILEELLLRHTHSSAAELHR